MKAGKKTLVSLVALLLAFSLVAAACSSNDKGNDGGSNTGTANTNTQADENAGNGEAAADDPAPADEPLEFSFYVNYDWYSPKGLDTDAKPIHTWLRNEKKVTIKEISSGGNAAQKLGTMIASNSLPDVIQMDRGADFDKLVAEGKLVALDEYLEKYPNLKSHTNEAMLNLLRSKDGKLYGIPNWFGDPKDESARTSHTGWVVNKKIYEELGSPALATFDDLYNFLKAVKEKYPDVVPLDSANTDRGVVQVQNMIYAGMGPNRPAEFTKTDHLLAWGDFDAKTFKPIFDDPAFLESYQFTSKLFREKLLTQDLMTQKREQFEEKLANGKIAVAATYDIAGAADKANTKLKEQGNEYITIAPIVKAGVDLNQVSHASYGSLGWNFNAITTSAKDPERIFAFFDWLMSPEGTTVAMYGPPGLYYEPDEKGFPIFNDKYKSLTPEQKENDGIGNTYFNLQGSPQFGHLEKVVMEREGIEKSWNAKANEFYGQWVRINGDQFNNVKNFSKGSEEDIINQQIIQIMEKAVAKMVFAPNDEAVKKEMEAARSQVEAAGYGKLLTFMNNVWASNREQMGL